MGLGSFVARGRWSLLRGPVPDQAAGLITAPSMTTPWGTYFHNATRSLRANATIARLRPCWLRSLNQRVRADCGWWRIHSPAILGIRGPSLGVPALDTPCPCRNAPL